MNKNSIKNIIYDLGGVILNINQQKTVDGFRKIGINHDENITQLLEKNKFFDDFETGLISENEFRQKINQLASKNLQNEKIDEIWNFMLLDFPEKRIKIIEKLQSEYNIFLLSNTNSIHVKHFCAEFEKQYSYSFDKLFKQVFYSFELKVRKPFAEIYRIVIEKAGLIPEQSLFIDDSQINIEAAKKLGFQTWHIKAGIDFTELFT